MTLKNKIALTFTLITSSLLIGICCIIYGLSFRYTRSDFYQRLHERANIIAIFMLEEDELSQKLYSEIKRQYLQNIPTEKGYLVNLDDLHLPDSLPSYINYSFVKTVDSQRFATKTVGDTSVVGIRYEDNQGDFAVIVAAEDRSGIRKLHNLMRVLAAVVLGYLLLVFFIGRWYADNALSPLADIIRQMRTINTTNLRLRIPRRRYDDELNQLANTFNSLLDRIETAVETQHNFISNASHELKNPLTAILGQIELALRAERSAEEYRQSLVRIAKEAERLEKLTLRLLHLAQSGFAESGKAFSMIRLDELLLDVVEEINETAPLSELRLHFGNMPAQSAQLEMPGNASLLKIAIANVIENAIKFSSGEPVDVYFNVQLGRFEIKITDLGVGIPASDVDKVFEPFFRSANAIDFQGFGVGLSLSKRILNIHQGNIAVQATTDRGTTMVITLPISPSY
jgi:signal transduction histidine kinase